MLSKERLDWYHSMLDGYLKEQYALAGSKQGSEEWRAAMPKTIGGSEMGSLLSRSQYRSYDDLVYQKACPDEQPRNQGVPCWWGKLFERFIRAVLEEMFGESVRGDDLCVRETKYHRNSPDGYFIAKVAREAKGKAAELMRKGKMYAEIIDAIIFLIEIKCPTSRMPDGKIPEDYYPQIQSGLSVSPVLCRGLFIDNQIVICSLGQLDFDDGYHIGYHKTLSRSAGELKTLPTALGLIAVYSAYDTGEYIDFGVAPAEAINILLRWVSKDDTTAIASPKNLRIDIMKPIFYGTEIGDRVMDFMDAAFEGAKEGEYLLGFVPCKLIRMFLTPVQRDEKMIASIEPLTRKLFEVDVPAFDKATYLASKAPKIEAADDIPGWRMSRVSEDCSALI